MVVKVCIEFARVGNNALEVKKKRWTNQCSNVILQAIQPLEKILSLSDKGPVKSE